MYDSGNYHPENVSHTYFEYILVMQLLLYFSRFVTCI